jgi:hypothetical protein
MQQIDDYIDSLFKNMDKSSIEVQDLKNEMRLHLMESVRELMKEEKSEEESIRIAIERFGDRQTLGKPLEKKYRLYNKFINVLMVVASSCALIFIGILLLYNWQVSYYYSNRDALFNKADEVFKPGHQITIEEEKQLEKLARRFTDSVFNYKYVALIRNDGYVSPQDDSHSGLINVSDHIQYIYPKDTANMMINGYSAAGDFSKKWTILYEENDLSIENFTLNRVLEYMAKVSIPLYLITSLLWFSWRAFIKKRLKPVWIFAFLICNVFGYLVFVIYTGIKCRKLQDSYV